MELKWNRDAQQWQATTGSNRTFMELKLEDFKDTLSSIVF